MVQQVNFRKHACMVISQFMNGEMLRIEKLHQN